MAAQVLVPAGILTSALYYFGYVRERAVFAHFGVDLGTLGFGNTDYVLRSADAIFAPLASTLLVGVVVLLCHQGVVAASAHASPRARLWAVRTLVVLALGLLVLGAMVLWWRTPWPSPYAAALATGIGALLLEYALASVTHDRRSAAGDAAPDSPWTTAVRRTQWPRRALVTGLALVAAFWWISEVAQQGGARAAVAIERSLVSRPEAVVYSGHRLAISGSGVTVVPLTGDRSTFRFRYQGLRVLAHSDGHWFLLPTGWSSHNGALTFVLPDATADVRVDLRPTPRP
jgi:hypothetical protein